MAVGARATIVEVGVGGTTGLDVGDGSLTTVGSLVGSGAGTSVGTAMDVGVAETVEGIATVAVGVGVVFRSSILGDGDTVGVGITLSGSGASSSIGGRVG